jgi:hypothetical protein
MPIRRKDSTFPLGKWTKRPWNEEAGPRPEFTPRPWGIPFSSDPPPPPPPYEPYSREPAPRLDPFEGFRRRKKSSDEPRRPFVPGAFGIPFGEARPPTPPRPPVPPTFDPKPSS